MTQEEVIEALCRIIEEALAVIEDEQKRRALRLAALKAMGEEENVCRSGE